MDGKEKKIYFKHCDRIRDLEKQRKKEVLVLQDISVLFECGEDYSSYINDIINGVDYVINAKDREVLKALLESYRNLMNIDKEILKEKYLRKYIEEVGECYDSYITQQTYDMFKDMNDERDKKFETYIPDEVETGIHQEEKTR